jgi:hypothetical protein
MLFHLVQAGARDVLAQEENDLAIGNGQVGECGVCFAIPFSQLISFLLRNRAADSVGARRSPMLQTNGNLGQCSSHSEPVAPKEQEVNAKLDQKINGGLINEFRVTFHESHGRWQSNDFTRCFLLLS